jgi:hypothetical protein
VVPTLASADGPAAVEGLHRASRFVELRRVPPAARHAVGPGVP